MNLCVSQIIVYAHYENNNKVTYVSQWNIKWKHGISKNTLKLGKKIEFVEKPQRRHMASLSGKFQISTQKNIFSTEFRFGYYLFWRKINRVNEWNWIKET